MKPREGKHQTEERKHGKEGEVEKKEPQTHLKEQVGKSRRLRTSRTGKSTEIERSQVRGCWEEGLWVTAKGYGFLWGGGGH